MDDKKQGGEEALHNIPAPKGPLAEREEKVLDFWNKEGIFKKSLEKPAPKGEYVFYDGPPFATGLPHYGHLLQSALKDAVPRYRTMQGYHVPRVWGWDCHGLPLENQIEQELGFKTKRDIEEYGIEKFNEAARSAVLRYADDWKKIIPRVGRWVDMEDDYRTMDTEYTESVWWAFKQLYDKKLIYEGFKAMHLCPRCGTTLSNFEVAQGYKDIDDLAVTVKLRLVDEPDTSILVWTTTAWTLPGNVAAAVNADATYVKIKVGNENYILAKELAEKVLTKSPGGGAPYAEKADGVKDFLEELSGRDLVGRRYEPPFPYFKNDLHKHKTHAFKVYAAPYVTLDSGTGIVHLAPAYGAEDLELAQKEKIPLIHHVTDEGKFVATVTDFAGLNVKPKGNPRETDEKVADKLEEMGLLFKKEKIKHSYPHCWRCDTPLLNWAANSWFVKVSSVKSNLIAQNKTVNWVPSHVGTGRFNNLLENAPDWAISRSRYWGAPLPVWRNTKTKEQKVFGSTEELLKMVRKSGNKYFVMRHGQAQSNLAHIFDSLGDPNNHLTEAGKGVALQTAQLLKKENIDLIIVSPLLRTQETAKIVQKELGLPDSALMTDERLREIHAGTFNGKNVEDWSESRSERFTKAPEGGETYADVRKRVGEFLFEIERRYTGKNILIVSHECPTWLLDSVAHMQTYEQVIEDRQGEFIAPGTHKEMPFTPYPHNHDYELDLHRPYIDEVPMGDKLNGEWKRIHDVFDCWFESGSMPYASNHYPKNKTAFNPKRLFGLMPKGYPAHFIAEGIDQTRGWFYSLIVLGTALFERTPYKAVVTNGLILAEDGRKMSKKLKNYPDPLELIEKYGVDSLRYYLLSSSVIRGEDLRFKEQGVDEVSKKVLMRLDNVRSFYEMYAVAEEKQDSVSRPEETSSASQAPQPDISSVPTKSVHILDRWVLSRLNETVKQSTDGYENYELDNATRPIASFVDDLSTWYLRRSRDRFKEEGSDKQAALHTLQTTLYTLSHIMAPVMPFFAEDLYQRVKNENDPESVHLSNWPSSAKATEGQASLIEEMNVVRKLASVGLQAREKAGIKLRQPLALLKAKTIPTNTELVEVLKDELNVKAIESDANQTDEVWLDTNLTDELKEEGTVRNLVRRVQEWRKSANLNIADRPDYTLQVSKDEERVAVANKDAIALETGIKRLTIEVADA
jgi:isoleucyl-tRNA synthetase